VTPERAVHYSILLAGGKSSRMGEDKAQLQIAGESFFQRGLKLLKASGSELVLVSGREAQADSISVPDIISQAGPPGGLYSCLSYLSSIGKLDDSPLLIMPLDMPFLDELVLQTLLDNMPGEGACHYAGEVLPCVVRASADLHQHLDKLFTESHELGGKRSMRAILEFCNSKILPSSLFSKTVFENINTMQDYEKSLNNFQKKSG
jgi:molybdopterin-guanine dinucleotide biosynthesis protein A